MSKIKILIILVFVVLICCCASSPKAPDDLDLRLREVSDYLNESIPRGRKIAFVNVQSDSAELTEYIIDELISNAVNDRNFSVVDRQQLDVARAELNFNASGEVSDQSAQAVGRMLGAQVIITGRVTKIGDLYRLNIRALVTETVEVLGSKNWNLSSGRTLLALMSSSGTGRIASSSSSGSSSNTRQTTTTSTRPTAPANGTYTFWPRLRATKAGLPVTNVSIGQVTVAGGYMTIHFARTVSGAWQAGDNVSYWPSGFYYPHQFQLQDLENPSRIYNPVSAQSHSNGMGGIGSISFRVINSKRYKLTFQLYSSDDPPYVIDEIILGEPDQ